MIYDAPKRFYAVCLLLVLLTAHVGQQVHIFSEDPAHFAAHSGALLPANGAHATVVDKCLVDDFYFFPFLDFSPLIPAFYVALLSLLLTPAVRCKSSALKTAASLRGPPAA